QSAPLPDREMDDAVVAAQHLAVKIDDVAGLGRTRPQARDHLAVAAGRHKADVLAVLLVGDRQPEAAGERAGLRLVALAERKPQRLELRARGGKQEIALVALAVAGAVECAPTARQGTGSH